MSEELEACRITRSAGWVIIAGAQSGETDDTWLADLAVRWSADQIKPGALARSERLARWNRLLAIESDTGLGLTGWPPCGLGTRDASCCEKGAAIATPADRRLRLVGIARVRKAGWRASLSCRSSSAPRWLVASAVFRGSVCECGPPTSTG